MSAKKPSDFLKHPYDSVLQHTEDEVVARNIMVILKRTGNTWRPLSVDEYEKERMKDGGYTGLEIRSFEKVRSYCESAERAESFSPAWRK